MKKYYLPFLFMLIVTDGIGQNVGIGTTNPQTQLHLSNSSSNTIRVEHTGTGGAAVEAKTNMGVNDLLLFKKWVSGASGTQAGIALSNLSQVIAGAGAGSLMVGTAANFPMHFITNNVERMRISEDGKVGINTGAAPAAGWLHVQSNNNTTPISVTNLATSGLSFGVGADIRSDIGAALSGVSFTAGVTAGFELGKYGILGTAGAGGTGVGAFSQNGGIALRAEIRDGAGKAIYSAGGLQLTGIGEGAGKILTSDATGNATWQGISGTHNHFGDTWTNSGARGLEVLNGSTTANTYAISGVASASGTNITTGVQGVSFSNQGIGVYGSTFGGGTTALGYQNVGVVGTAGNGIGLFGSSVSGYSIYGLKPNGSSYTGPVGRFQNDNPANTDPVIQVVAAGAQPALELNNGYIKVSGTNKSAFIHTATSDNITSNFTNIDYPNSSMTDILIITHNWQGSYIGAVGTFWNGTAGKWAIFREDQLALPANEKFNVMVIKQ